MSSRILDDEVERAREEVEVDSSDTEHARIIKGAKDRDRADFLNRTLI